MLQAKTYSSFFRFPIPCKPFERAAANSSPHLLLRKLECEAKGKKTSKPKADILICLQDSPCLCIVKKRLSSSLLSTASVVHLNQNVKTNKNTAKTDLSPYYPSITHKFIISYISAVLKLCCSDQIFSHHLSLSSRTNLRLDFPTPSPFSSPTSSQHSLCLPQVFHIFAASQNLQTVNVHKTS